MANTFEFLHKGFVKAVFSDVPELNVIPQDMGQSMITVNSFSPSVTRLPTATGTVASAEIFVEVDITVSILKASPADSIYTQRFIQNGVIPGSVTLYDDVNKAWNFTKLSIAMNGFSANAGEASRDYTLTGIFPVNTQLIAQLGSGN